MAQKQHGFFSHQTLEKNIGLMIIASILVVSVAGLVQIIPLFFQHSTTQAMPGVEPYEPLQLMGRDVYIREGCVGCHSQQVRTLQAEVQRYGPYSVAGSRCSTIPSCGAPSEPAPTWRAWASAIPTNGTASTCAIRAPWCPSPTCPPIRGCSMPT